MPCYIIRCLPVVAWLACAASPVSNPVERQTSPRAIRQVHGRFGTGKPCRYGSTQAIFQEERRDLTMTTNQRIRLTELASCAGCAAKTGAGILAEVLRPLRQRNVPAQLIVGLGAIDDAAVYKVNDQQAIISTADFFPPVVDDPYTFGSIAAANALSDVYAMGGQVLMAINIVAWPDNLDTSILSEVLR